MDQELKQRLIGAVVVTALAAIFIPMLFDDPSGNNGQVVSELTVPDSPAAAAGETADKLPSSADEVAGTFDRSDMAADNPEADINPLETADSDSDEALSPVDEQFIDEKKWIEESSGDIEPLDEAELAQAETLETNPDEPPTNQAADNKTAPSNVSQPPEAPSQAEQKTTTDIAKAGPATTDSGLVRYYLQAGFFGKKENAVSLWERLRKQGFPTFIETVPTAKGTFYRLKVGPELDKKRAAEIQARLKQQNIKTFIVSE